MNTEIKFRGWNPHAKEMFDPMPIVDFEIIRINGHVLLQFTGWQDSAKKDIYVGDIFGNEFTRCVVYRKNDGAYVLRFLDKRIKDISILDHKVSKSTIVGNIFENPELFNTPHPKK